MNLNILKSKINYYPALVLEDAISHQFRRKIIKSLSYFEILFLIVFIFSGLGVYLGIFFVLLSVSLVFYGLDCFYFSLFNQSYKDENPFSFLNGQILFHSEDCDPVRGFFFSDIGDEVMLRLGISEGDVVSFIKSRPKNFCESLPEDITDQKIAKEFSDLPSIKNFLLSRGISPEQFSGCFNWVVSRTEELVDQQRFWSLEKISKIPGIGKDWSDKEAYQLERIAKNLNNSMSGSLDGFKKLYQNAVSRVERALSKSYGANAILICQSEEEGVDVMSLLAEKIRNGEASSELSYKKIFLIEPETVLEGSKQPKEIEEILFKSLVEAAAAGNTVVVFPRFVSFIKTESVGGIDVISMLQPVLSSQSVSIVILEDMNTFDENRDLYSGLTHKMEVIKIEEEGEDADLEMLKREAFLVEAEKGVLITFPALLTIKNESMKHFGGYAESGESRTILLDAVSYVKSQKRRVLVEKDVLKIIEEKTGVPSLNPESDEKDKLLDLENVLHKKIIGQDEAIKSISSALRRSRAGISSQSRPMGSFLFLGPTGVGKTETAKALAEVMFKDSAKLSRIDMSEYQANDAMARLIGSYGNKKQGSLSTLLRDHPYGVLLLDEFEKATYEIHNLFLQVFDEGFFTDAESKKINARDTIFIATSNAGSSMIWDVVQSGADLYSEKDKIIDSIIKEKIFAPELLNRFDGIIFFHPLTNIDLKQIASLMFAELQDRLEKKAIKLAASDKILDYLVKIGSDPKFGARPMRRAIEENLEEDIAKALISGKLKSGKEAYFETDGDSVRLKVNG